MLVSKLPGRDYSIAHWSADDLEIEAARLVREAKQQVPKKGSSAAVVSRRAQKAGQLAYGAVLCVKAARRMRRRGAGRYADLKPKDMTAVIAAADKTHAEIVARAITIDEIFD